MVEMGNNFSNNTLHLNDTLKFVGCSSILCFYLYNKFEGKLSPR